ncbi:MAG: hypothetical protein K940chlam5_00822 [Candidatus Anoxychlamydiales bacterium]|nr:hypothetical protein [Candidatus Anoxychlamydiales bacterium]
MSSVSTPSKPTITTFQFTNEHLSHPGNFGIDSKRESDDKPFINFSILGHKPVCAILKTAFEEGDTVAKCTNCFNAFLARNLYRHFIFSNKKRTDSEIKRMTAPCPGCRQLLSGKDLNITEIEKLKIQIDLLNDKIADLEGQKERGKEDIERYTLREEEFAGHFLNLNAEPDEEVGSEASKVVSDLKNSTISTIGGYKSRKENEIAELQKAIDSSKKRIDQLNALIENESEKFRREGDSSKVKELKDKILALESALNLERTKNARGIVIPHTTDWQDNTTLIVFLSLAIFLGYAFLQNTTYFCPVPQH